MTSQNDSKRRQSTRATALAFLLAFSTAMSPVFAESGYDEDEEPAQRDTPQRSYTPSAPRNQRETRRRKYFQEDPSRVDAGIFHVGFAAGGNFYIEPMVDNNKVPTGDFFKDFGFQAGAYFDYDYSELDENIPLMLRGMVGYKYILSSVHVFTFDGMVRHMWRWSEKAAFGLGMGGSAAMWYRTVTTTSANEEIVILPSLLLGAGFEFQPFMVDFKWLINRIASDNVIMGFELYFGFRL
jgi:hypothetical protein